MNTNDFNTTSGGVTYTPTIGIEVHAELKTKSKMFCGCKNDPHASDPNTNICPVCMAHPGTLPMPNKDAVQKLLMIGKAVGGETATFTEFDRKNYFYPDIPKAYQISQYEFPFVRGGNIAGVELTRIHLEEDTARSLHDQGEGSVVDFNRAGVPLMELVTEPVIHDAKTAAAFTKELQLLLRTLGVSDANMERGEMRVEANISVSDSEHFGTKVEVKNLNSFKAMEQAILFEVKRQSAALKRGEEIVQETRGWDENRSRTFLQRVKETADDYRYFPDPDIPKIETARVEEFSDSRLSEIMPDTPKNKRNFYAEISVPRDQAELIIADMASDDFFRKVVDELQDSTKAIQLAANYLTSDIFSLLEEDGGGKNIASASPVLFAKLIRMLESTQINSRVAKDLLPEVLFENADPEKLAKERDLLQMSDESTLLPIVEKVIQDNATVVADYKAGKEASLQYLVGQGMKATKGSANPSILQSLLERKLPE